MPKLGDVREKPEAGRETTRRSDEASGSAPALGDDHPLNEIIGTYDGPIWERILKNIKRNRKIEDGNASAGSE
jgi:hypothetical protein